MNNTLKIVLAVVVFGAMTYLGMSYPKYSESFGATATSTPGATYNSAKFAAVVVSLASPGANATSSSVFNGDVSDRFVSGFRVGCQGLQTSRTAYTGAGLASLQLTIGTTTTSAPATIPAASVVASAFVISTTTTSLTVASTSAATNAGSIWPSGTYMTFWFNATNTAACTVGVDYFGF